MLACPCLACCCVCPCSFPCYLSVAGWLIVTYVRLFLTLLLVPCRLAFCCTCACSHEPLAGWLVARVCVRLSPVSLPFLSCSPLQARSTCMRVSPFPWLLVPCRLAPATSSFACWLIACSLPFPRATHFFGLAYCVSTFPLTTFSFTGWLIAASPPPATSSCVGWLFTPYVLSLFASYLFLAVAARCCPSCVRVCTCPRLFTLTGCSSHACARRKLFPLAG